MPDKRRQESERKKQALFAIATEEFGRKGYKALSMDHLAQRAGISKGLIFVFYGSKKALFTEVIEHRLNTVRRVTAEKQALADSPLQSLEIAFRTGFEFTRQHPDMCQLFSEESQQVVPEILREHRFYWIETFAACLRDAQALQLLKSDVDIDSSARIIYHLHKALFDALFSGDDTALLEQDVATAITLQIRGLASA